MKRMFHDRSEAGKMLAAQLDRYRNQPDVVVVGLPRGGVPVAYDLPGAWALRWTFFWFGKARHAG